MEKEFWLNQKSESQEDVRIGLLEKLRVAHIKLSSDIADWRSSGDNDAVIHGEQRVSSLQALQAAVVSAKPMALVSIRAEILASIAPIGTSGLQARTAGSQRSAEMASLAAVRAASRQLADSTQRALFEDEILDASLRFASPAEKEAYRQREAERLALIDSLDPRNPRSARDQLLIQRDQVDDAMAHGADRDPRAQQMRDQIDRQLRLQREAEIQAGRDPKEYDREVATLQASLPRHGRSARAEERAAFIAGGWTAEMPIAGVKGAAMPALAASSAMDQKHALAAAAGEMVGETPATFDDPVQQAAAQLKAAGVSAPAVPEAVTPGSDVRTAQTGERIPPRA